MAIPTHQNQKATLGKPCPGCGCPYPGDHTLDCRYSFPVSLPTTDAAIVRLAEMTSQLAEQLCKTQEQILRLTTIIEAHITRHKYLNETD